jgi:hypothetical protein
MIHTFDRDGIHIQYPANWTLEMDSESSPDGGWAASVQSPETAFLLVSLRPEAGDPASLADQTLDALKAEYKELDAENVVGPLAGLPAIGHDVDFLSVDTAITCRTRCVDTPAGPLLVMAQVSDYDRARNDPVLQAIIASLMIDEE